MNKNLINFLGLYKELLFLIVIAALLGFYKLGERPLPVNQDELSNIYDAYSLSKTGADRFGHKFPIVLEAFGKADYRPALYAWLAVIPIKINGLSVVSGRSISVICYIFCLVFLYLSAVKIFDKRAAVLTGIIFIFSPWSWFYARSAHEGSMLPSLFVIAALYFFIKIYKERQHSYLNFILLGFIIGFSTNAYQSSRLIAPLILILIFIFFIAEIIEQKNRKLSAMTISCFIGALPQIYIFIFYPDYFYGRYDSVKLNEADTFQNIYQFINNIYTDLSPGFLFLNFGKPNSLTISRFLEAEAVFFYIGLISIFKINNVTNRNTALFIILLLVICIIPCSLTKYNPNALRLSCMLVICPLFISAGFYFIILKIKNYTIQNTLLLIAIIIIMLSFNIQYNKYKHHQPVFDHNQQNSLVQVSEKLNLLYTKYDTILFEDSGNQAYIYFLYYCHIEPEEFRKMEKIYSKEEFYEFKKMGKFYFLPYEDILKMEERNNSNDLIISHSYPYTYSKLDSVVTPEITYYLSESKD